MFAFVILHYLAEEMTCECVDKLIARFKDRPIHIVVVDNGSANGSGARLQEKYAAQELVTVLLSGENLGFARGNNIGYSWAKAQFNPDYMIIMNNDVLVEDATFLDKIAEIHAETDFHVLGPDIYACKARRHQNPIRLKPRTRQEVQRFIDQRKRWMACYPLHYYKELMRTALKKKEAAPAPAADRHTRRLINPVLHGACYIFSRAFIEAEDSAFHPGTFLYYEEYILHYLCMGKGYKMVYDPGIAVTHLEDVSTRKGFRNGCRRAKMKDENLMKSAGILLKMMEQENT